MTGGPGERDGPQRGAAGHCRAAGEPGQAAGGLCRVLSGATERLRKEWMTT